jgi:hypothetical protein
MLFFGHGAFWIRLFFVSHKWLYWLKLLEASWELLIAPFEPQLTCSCQLLEGRRPGQKSSFFFVSLNYWMCIIEPIELQLGPWTGRRRERWYDNWLSVSVVFLCAAYTIIGVSVMYQYRNPWPFLCLIKCNAHKSIIALPYFSDKTRAVKSTFFFSMSSLLKSIYSFKQDMEKQNDQINSIRSFLRVHLINYLAAGVLYRFWCLFVKGDSRLR